MEHNTVDATRQCWCGNSSLAPYSDDYRVCTTCQTLVSQVGLSTEELEVKTDDTGFYGKDYWLGHMANDLDLPNIHTRARQDLPERCLYWLKTLLAYKLPPAAVLEVGCSHGGFVALMRGAGFEASGLELSPWVADFARTTFQVPVHTGPIEQQNIAPQSLDAIVLNDVVEHLPDPIGTLRHCIELLRPDGILLIQMPDYPEGKSYQDLVAVRKRFLDHMKKADEHLYLYSQQAALRLMETLGMSECRFEPSLFDYDMYLVASRQPLVRHNDEQISARLSKPSGRLVRALLDSSRDEEFRMLHAACTERLEGIHKLCDQIAAKEAEHAAALAASEAKLAAAEQAAHQAAQAWEKDFNVLNTACTERLDAINRLCEQLSTTEAQHAASVAQQAAAEAQHAAALAERDAQHAAALAERDAQHAAILAERDAQHGATLAERDAQHGATLAERDAQHAAALAACETKHAAALTALEAEHAEALAACEAKLEAAVRAASEAAAKASMEIQNLNDRLASNHVRHASEMAATEGKFLGALEASQAAGMAVIQQLSAELAASRTTFARRLRRLPGKLLRIAGLKRNAA